MAENTGFRYMVNTMEPRYVIPTCKHIMEVAVPRMYEEVNQTVETQQKEWPLCDGRTSRTTKYYVMITLHHIDVT